MDCVPRGRRMWRHVCGGVDHQDFSVCASSFPFFKPFAMDSVIQWDANKVYSWLASIGFPAYEKQFKGTPPLALSNELNQAPPFPLIRASHTLQPPIHRLFVINIAVRTAHVGIIVTNSLTFITLRVHLVPITLENGITGDVLVNLDHEALKDLSIRSVGKRMAILKAIYNLKVAHNVPILEGDYVPPCE